VLCAVRRGDQINVTDFWKATPCSLLDSTNILKETSASNFGKGKGKAIPLQDWTGPEGSRRLRLPDFKTIDI
jgi:hypothetical protein